MRVNTTWTNNNTKTIYNVLKAKLGREPTNPELAAEVHRIMSEAMVDAAEKGKLPHQRKR